jgi:hypothetical protein
MYLARSKLLFLGAESRKGDVHECVSHASDPPENMALRVRRHIELDLERRNNVHRDCFSALANRPFQRQFRTHVPGEWIVKYGRSSDSRGLAQTFILLMPENVERRRAKWS